MRGALFFIVHTRGIPIVHIMYVYCVDLSIRFVDTLVWDRSQKMQGFLVRRFQLVGMKKNHLEYGMR